MSSTYASTYASAKTTQFTVHLDIDAFGHRKVRGCASPAGYCADKRHRLRDTLGFTCAQHRTLAHAPALSDEWIKALVDLAQMARTDELADEELWQAGVLGLDTLSNVVRHQKLHKISGIRRYMTTARTAARTKTEKERLAAERVAAGLPTQRDEQLPLWIRGAELLLEQDELDATLTWDEIAASLQAS